MFIQKKMLRVELHFAQYVENIFFYYPFLSYYYFRKLYSLSNYIFVIQKIYLAGTWHFFIFIFLWPEHPSIMNLKTNSSAMHLIIFHISLFNFLTIILFYCL